jgi:DNA-binding MarR family transcriptional regulator
MHLDFYITCYIIYVICYVKERAVREINQKLIFGNLFKLANTLQTYLDHQLKDTEVTSKQLLLMIIVGSFDYDPTLKEVATKWGTSYQNVKQISLKLEKADFLIIVENPKDKRSKCLKLSNKAIAFWNEREQSDELRMNQLFSNFSDEELSMFTTLILKTIESIEEV